MDTSIEAVGAVLSQKNTSTVKNAWQALTELLLASGNLSFSDIPKELISAQSVYDAQKKDISAAGTLSEMVTVQTWHQSLRTVMEYFQSMFYDVVCSENPEKDARITELTSDFLAIVRDLAKNPPRMTQGGQKIYAGDRQKEATSSEVPAVEQPTPDNSELASAPEVEPAPEAPPKPESEVVSDLERLLQASLALEEPTAVQAASQDLSFSALEEDNPLVLQIEAKARIELSATNERSVEGILFKIDHPSEAIPSVGPGLPLYIPRSVASEALACLDFSRPKPIDAHDSLSKHASTEIVGAMTSARIDGDDFWVTGVLWDYNQPHKVEAISASQDHLGMSVNATAEGHPAEVHGRSVWQIDRLRILGANILFSEKATFKKTRTNVLASSASGDLIPVLASADDFELENNTPDISETEITETMDTSNISTQIRELSEGVAAMHAEVKNRLNALEPTVKELTSQMGEIQAAAREAKNQEVQAAAMQAEQEKQAQLLQSMTQVFEEKLASLAPRTGPKYPSRVLPLAASGAAPASGATAVQLELASLNGQIMAMEQNPYSDSAKIFELMDRKKTLEGQIGQARE
jgi:hypothetical protein